MTLAIILIIFAVFVAVVMYVEYRRHKQQLSVQPKPAKQIQPIDIEAFRNLVDPAETDYLRRRLPLWEFHSVQRQRLLAMFAYVSTVHSNAAFLITIGNRALSTADPNTVEAAQQLADHAMLLRRNAFYALVQICIAWLWPGTPFAATQVFQGYVRLNGSAMLLGRLRNPAAPVRISAT
jgi:hypothetical protein